MTNNTLTSEQEVQILERRNQELEKAITFLCNELNQAIGAITEDEKWTPESAIDASKWQTKN